MRSPLVMLFCLLFLFVSSSIVQLLSPGLAQTGQVVAPATRLSQNHPQIVSTATAVQATVLFSSLALSGNQTVAFHHETLLSAQNSSHISTLSSCPSGSRSYVVVAGDTLSTIADRFGTTWMALSSFNHLLDPNLIQISQVLCIPSAQAPAAPAGPTSIIPTTPASPQAASINPFHYGQCTWWADQRYYQLHQVFVPWTTSADAWRWTDLAYQFGWHVSSTPSPGAIIDLQPWVQGAYSLGHVAVVEQVLSNGHVIASTMNWGKSPLKIQNVEFTPGPGVTFIFNWQW